MSCLILQKFILLIILLILFTLSQRGGKEQASLGGKFGIRLSLIILRYIYCKAKTLSTLQYRMK